MPSVLHDVPVMPPPQAPPRKRWTREQVAAAEASGIFDGEKLELINGELIDKMPKNWRHVETLMLLGLWLREVFGGRFVATEAPLDVHPADNSTSEPEPDAIVLKHDLSKYRSVRPQPQDLRLVAEISDTTLTFDRSVKAALYARAGIPEFWVLDVKGRRLIVHRDPAPEGYRSVTAYSEHESVAPLAAPEHAFCWATVMATPEEA
jgi:Uma2 family endonuclease